jgi:hypothetical protein
VHLLPYVQAGRQGRACPAASAGGGLDAAVPQHLQANESSTRHATDVVYVGLESKRMIDVQQWEL